MGAHDGTLGLLFDAPVDPVAVPAVPQVREAVPFTWSEEHRHACEVRHVLAMGAERARDYCRGVERFRGRPAADRLWNEARALNKKKETDNDDA